VFVAIESLFVVFMIFAFAGRVCLPVLLLFLSTGMHAEFCMLHGLCPAAGWLLRIFNRKQTRLAGRHQKGFARGGRFQIILRFVKTRVAPVLSLDIQDFTGQYCTHMSDQVRFGPISGQ